MDANALFMSAFHASEDVERAKVASETELTRAIAVSEAQVATLKAVELREKELQEREQQIATEYQTLSAAKVVFDQEVMTIRNFLARTLQTTRQLMKDIETNLEIGPNPNVNFGLADLEKQLNKMNEMRKVTDRREDPEPSP